MATPASQLATAQKTDVFTISDIPSLKAVADPLRMRLVFALDDADLTVKELAAKLGVPQTRLYYHVKLLESAGVLRVASTRMVSGIEERRYASTARSWTVSDDLLTAPEVSDVLKAMFDLARAELVLAFGEGGNAPGDPSGSVPVLSMTKAFLSEDEVRELAEALQALLMKFSAGNPGPGKAEYHAIFTLYREMRTRDAS
jgi:DNA-binding transcriptional ArsR family regulator